MLEALRILSADEDEEVRDTVTGTLRTYDVSKLRPIVDNPELAPRVLGFLVTWKGLPRDLFTPVLLHKNAPAEAIEQVVTTTESGEFIEIVSLKQQTLIQHPSLIDAILNNPRRTPEAERRAREVREEFFEKDYGAQFVAEEQRAQSAEAETEAAVVGDDEPLVFHSDLSQFIEADLLDVGDDLYDQFITEFGSLIDEAELDELGSGTEIDLDTILASDEFKELRESEEFRERVSVFARIARMSVKDRIRFALKGTREVRMILIRDPNRPVCAAVIMNPRITSQEVETISALKSVNEEVLRVIGMSRAWTRNYTVIHNLVRNPKTPIALSMNFLNRIQSRDLRQLGLNKNIPEVIRTTAGRMYLKRQHG